MPARKTSPCTKADGRTRLRTATAYLDVAKQVLTEEVEPEFFNVAAGLAVLSGVAASDALCCAGLRQRHRGDDHRAAADLLEQSTPDGKAMANAFRRLIDLKDAAHYGIVVVSRADASKAIRWAQQLVDRARVEFER